MLSTEQEAVGAARSYADAIAPGAALLGSPELRERLFANVLAGQRSATGWPNGGPSTPRTCTRG
jgi:hypothetical protein